jgi:hypothetical protein
VLEVQFNRILRDIPMHKGIEECAPTACISLEQQYNLFSKLYPYYLKRGVNEFVGDQAVLEKILAEACKVSNRMLFQRKYRVRFEKGGVWETKEFTVCKESVISSDFPEIYYPISVLLNELLVRPHLSQFHPMALTLIRRLYVYYPHMRNNLTRPLMLLFTNIVHFGSEECKKQAAIFLYQLIHQEKDEEIKNMATVSPKEANESTTLP